MHYIYCLLILISTVVGVLLAIYATYYLITLHKVMNMDAMHNFYSVGYLAKGDAIQWAIVAITGGMALFAYSCLESMKKGMDTYDRLRSEKNE